LIQARLWPFAASGTFAASYSTAASLIIAVNFQTELLEQLQEVPELKALLQL